MRALSSLRLPPPCSHLPATNRQRQPAPTLKRQTRALTSCHLSPACPGILRRLSRPASQQPRSTRRGLRQLQVSAVAAATLPLQPDRQSLPAWQRWLHSPFDRDIVALWFPALFSVLMEPLMSLVDCAVVGRISVEALAGVGLSVYICGASNILFNFLIITTTPAVARALAAKDRPLAQRVTARGVWITLTCGLALTLALYLGAPAALQAMGAQPEVASQAIAYLNARCLGIPAGLLIFVAFGTFRGAKDTRTPALVGAAALVINFVLDMTLVFGMGMGVAGAAWATVASQYFNAGMLFSMLHRRDLFRISALTPPPTWRELRPVTEAAGSIQLRNASNSAVMLYGTLQAMSLGTSSLAAHEVLRQLSSFCIYFAAAWNVTSQTLQAAVLASGTRAEARAVAGRLAQLGGATGAVMAAVLLGLTPVIPGLFTQNAVVASQIQAVLPIVLVTLPIDGAEKALYGTLLAAQEMAWLARNTVLTSAVCCAALWASGELGLGLLGIWASVKLVITAGRLAGDVIRLSSADSPLRG